jgi:hypothetical protein
VCEGSLGSGAGRNFEGKENKNENLFFLRKTEAQRR